jgi:hypothetical protein
MDNIDININQAELFSIYVSFNSLGLVTIAATLSLLSGNIKIAEFRLSNESWQMDSNKFEPSAELISFLRVIQTTIEKIAVQKCNAALKQIPATLSTNPE